MEKEIKQRIKDILSYYKITQNKLAGENRPLQKRLSRQLNQDVPLSCDTLFPIIEAFPDVSLEWLFRGEGEMIKS